MALLEDAHEALADDVLVDFLGVAHDVAVELHFGEVVILARPAQVAVNEEREGPHEAGEQGAHLGLALQLRVRERLAGHEERHGQPHGRDETHHDYVAVRHAVGELDA